MALTLPRAVSSWTVPWYKSILPRLRHWDRHCSYKKQWTRYQLPPPLWSTFRRHWQRIHSLLRSTQPPRQPLMPPPMLQCPPWMQPCKTKVWMPPPCWASSQRQWTDDLWSIWLHWRQRQLQIIWHSWFHHHNANLGQGGRLHQSWRCWAEPRGVEAQVRLHNSTAVHGGVPADASWNGP